MKILSQYSSLLLITLLFTTNTFAQSIDKKEINRLEKTAKQVQIIRDQWGIAHVYGATDADAVFGLLYAQCEDDFKRVEMNYIEKLGRLAEVKGQSVLYNDLETRLLIDTEAAQADYKKAAPWMKKLLQSFADGVNYYLYKHPEVKPKLLQHFEPWYPLLWTDGSIGAISTGGLTTAELKTFYSGNSSKIAYTEREPNVQTGSNGFAIAPSKSVTGNAMLYTNPHTTFYFRPEIQMSSNEGLQAYGAVTWGQFFIYQGFNENCGWMHTSSNVDVADLYAEKIVKKKNQYFYEYEGKLRAVQQKNITISYLENGKLIPKTFTTYATHHGPIMGERGGKWISLRANNRSMIGLEQSWLRTKSTSFASYQTAMDLKANTSNNTVYADKEGNIAYWHGNFVPKRDLRFNWSKEVDGSIKTTEWQGLHTVAEIVHAYNPKNGWLQNCNSTPFTVAGIESPKAQNYPNYMAPDGENFRGLNAVRLLGQNKKYTLEQLIADGYNTKLTAFEFLIPALLNAYAKTSAANTDTYKNLEEPIAILRNWDYHADEKSVATTLAVEWAYRLDPILQKVYVNQGEKDQVQNAIAFAEAATAEQLLPQLQAVVADLQSKFNTWQVPWGTINRFQRSSGAIDLTFDDNKESLPIGFGPALWGSLPAYKSSYAKNTIKRYGSNGNSFICAVEFGPKVKAKSLLAGGNSGDVNSKHFDDQAEMYQKGVFKDVLFYKEDVLANAKKSYHPGE
ncbi:penicillin acylase family protein [Flavobacterium sp. F-328]|uniref:Penicillin acylase family protein n=1 Tax=Flavobacterium erciyesense TaxID=2825842 RepID=A0ABS5D7I9_9FLAO|nr:penicillin acylase family protein [Flavobacterium erciyesense]MBQ0910004.1 penicillin acylase family protein [Flavobacterium erciyesense]